MVLQTDPKLDEIFKKQNNKQQQHCWQTTALQTVGNKSNGNKNNNIRAGAALLPSTKEVK